ncbi:hypothetical protein SO802_033933 [Lithocarpus litseifolius]|uniref:Uncharacterized protein n=1 Tax=Lithocarpus litseifolius TaxID=425828 RepID=A0AAW2BG45_9ROSI
MAKRKASLHTREKSAALDGTSTQDVDQALDQAIVEVSTQGQLFHIAKSKWHESSISIQGGKGATSYMCHSQAKYLDIWDLLDDQVIELPLNSMLQPVDEGARTFIGWLGTIARKPHMCSIRYFSWKAMPKDLKEGCWCLVERKYSMPTNPIAYVALKTFTFQKIGKAWKDCKCRLKNKHYIPDSRNKAWMESKKNKDRRSKQDDLHSASSCSFVVHGAKKDKMKELLVDPSNQLQLSDTSCSIA